MLTVRMVRGTYDRYVAHQSQQRLSPKTFNLDSLSTSLELGTA